MSLLRVVGVPRRLCGSFNGRPQASIARQPMLQVYAAVCSTRRPTPTGCRAGTRRAFAPPISQHRRFYANASNSHRRATCRATTTLGCGTTLAAIERAGVRAPLRCIVLRYYLAAWYCNFQATMFPFCVERRLPFFSSIFRFFSRCCALPHAPSGPMKDGRVFSEFIYARAVALACWE